MFINSFKHLQTSFVSLASLSNSNFSLLDRPVPLRVMGVIDLVSPKLAFMGMMLVKLILTDSQANTEGLLRQHVVKSSKVTVQLLFTVFE